MSWWAWLLVVLGALVGVAFFISLGIAAAFGDEIEERRHG